VILLLKEWLAVVSSAAVVAMNANETGWRLAKLPFYISLCKLHAKSEMLRSKKKGSSLSTRDYFSSSVLFFYGEMPQALKKSAKYFLFFFLFNG